MKKTAELSDIINDLGNTLTGLKWPEDTKDIFKRLTCIHFDLQIVEKDLKDCVNELCLKCGQYKQSHLGACDGCRWKKVKEDMR